MENTQKNYMKGFVPYAIAAAVLSLCGGFTASVPTAISTAWNTDASLTFITLAYSLAAAAMAPIMGKLGGAIGRRKMLLFAMGLYTVGQALIAICPPNIPLLLVFRFMVGIGAAGIAPVVMAYIMMEFPPEKMGQGFTIYMALACGMVIFGPTLGGIVMALIGTADAWRIVMWICVALCVISFVLCFAMVRDNPNIPKGSMKGFDWAGAVFVLIMFGALVCVPTFGQQSGWTAVATLASIAAAVIGLIVLVFVEKKAASPILSGKFIARKNFILPVIVLFLTQGLMTACLTEIIRFGYAVDKASVASIAMSIEYLGMAIGTIVLGPMSDKKEPKIVAAIALVFVAIGSAIMLLINETSGVLLMGGALFFVGLGLGGNTTIFMKVALSGVAPAESSSASGTFNVFKDMCAPFGVAIFVPMFVTGMGAKAAAGMAVPAAATSALHSVALVQLVCVIVGIVVCFLLPTVRAKKEA
ncbi:MAG: MFS transporter [Oscillospiraceae bacterium]|nr:MFS transporter [Oscillospiraceae bacterium]